MKSQKTAGLAGAISRVPHGTLAPGAIWLGTLVSLASAVYVQPTLAAIGLAAVGIGLPLMWLVWAHPEVGALALVFLTSSFVRPDAIDFRLPVGGFDLRDITFMSLLGMLAVKALGRRHLRFPWWPVSGPLMALVGWAAFSALYALLYKRVEANWTLGELRPVLYYAAFFASAWGIVRRKQVVVLLVGMFVLADLTAVTVFLQEFRGSSIALLDAMSGPGADWRVWQMGNVEGFGAVRVVPPGHLLMYTMAIVAFCLMFADHQRWWLRLTLFFQFVGINAALVFTYTRAQWIASTIALGFVVMLLPRADKARMLRYTLIAVLSLVAAYALFASDLNQALSNTSFADVLGKRALSILTPAETLDTYSLQWRIFETDEAARSISENPLLGVGLGNVYRPATLLQGETHWRTSRFTRYVHNSYLYIAVKMGLPGLLAFACFALSLLWASWRTYGNLKDGTFKRISLALPTAFIGILFWALTQSHLLAVESTATLGILAGIVASIREIEWAGGAGPARAT